MVKSDNPEFDYAEDLTLEDDRILLQPLEVSHSASLLPVAEDASLWQYVWDDASTEQSLRSYVIEAVEARHHGRQYPWAIYDKRLGAYVGSTRIYEINMELAHLKMGYTWVAKEAWGTGINARAKFPLLQFAFEKLLMKRVGFGVHEKNLRSLYALQKIGCKQEGRLCSFLPGRREGLRHDLVLLSLLVEEWHEGAKQRLQATMSLP